MKYNQKRSRIWNAGSTFLRQGKKVVEPYSGKGDTLLGIRQVAEDVSKNESKHEAQDTFQVVAMGTAGELGEDKSASSHQGGILGKEFLPEANSALSEVPVVAVVSSEVKMQDLQETEEGNLGLPVIREGGDLGISVDFGDRGGLGLQMGIGEGGDALTLPIDVREESDLGVPVDIRDGGDLALPIDIRGGGNLSLPFVISKDTSTQIFTVPTNVGGPLMKQLHEGSHSNQGHVTGISKQMRVNHMNADVKVEILENTGSEDVRPNSRDDATECSSSFGYTRSKEESDPELDGFPQNAEVESELRDGNGALASACAEDDENGGGIPRGKKALNADWKKYRRGIEWRCRWLEVRLNELRARAQKYDRMLEERRAKKAWLPEMQPGEESSARTVQMVDSSQRGHILRRLRRKQVENDVDLDVYMARHPLFSRYDKKRKQEMDDFVEAKIDTGQHAQSQLNSMEPEGMIQDESDTEEQVVVGRSSSLGGQDSMEQILWNVEALQARVEKAKFQLSKGAPLKSAPQPLSIPKPPGHLTRGPIQPSPRASAPGMVPRPPATKGRPPAGQSPGLSGPPSANGAFHKQGSASLRRKSSDYDINNMVMPVSVGAKYVEHIKHADIWTPHWRLVDDTEAGDQSLGGSSSDEDTDDDRFVNRHSDMEVNEKKQRYMFPIKRSPDGEPPASGKGRSKSGMGKGAGKMSGRGSGPAKVVPAVAIESADSSLSPAFAGSFPKGKRRKRLFNATSFTTNHAQRRAAYLAESSTSSQSPEAAGDGALIQDTLESKPLEEFTSGLMSIPEPGELNGQFERST